MVLYVQRESRTIKLVRYRLPCREYANISATVVQTDEQRFFVKKEVFINQGQDTNYQISRGTWNVPLGKVSKAKLSNHVRRIVD